MSIENQTKSMGDYVDETLAGNECVMHETHFHWIIFLRLSGIITFGLYPYIERWTSEFVITNRRIVIKTGLIQQRTMELNIHKVESVQVIQSILGRLLDYGTVAVIGSGGTKEIWDYIAHPLLFRRAYQQQV